MPALVQALTECWTVLGLALQRTIGQLCLQGSLLTGPLPLKAGPLPFYLCTIHPRTTFAWLIPGGVNGEGTDEGLSG